MVVDATASTPVLLRPLEHGADVVLHSATKYLGGHHDALLGALVTRDDETYERLKRLRGLTGPDRRAGRRGAAVARARDARAAGAAPVRVGARAGPPARRPPAVGIVRYPGLGDERASRFMEGGFGGMLSFDVADNAAALAVETSTRVITNATSLGGVHSTMESRYRWEGDRVPEGLLRLSVGLETVEALWPTSSRRSTGRRNKPEAGLEPTAHALQERCSTS